MLSNQTISKEKINIVYTLDDGFAMQAAVSLVSLFSNNTDLLFHIFIVSDHIRLENIERLKGVAKAYHQRMDIVHMPDLKELGGVDFATNGWGKATYCRLFLASLLPDDIEKIIYIDSDTLIVDDILGLVEILNSKEFDNKYLGACLDSKATFKRFHSFKRSEKYINTGLLLVNLKRWRQDKIEQKLLCEVERRRGKSIDTDQSYLNCLLANKIMTLPAKYNVMSLYYTDYRDYLKKSGYKRDEIYSEGELKDAVEHPVIIHFAGDREYRPWYIHCKHSRKDEWFSYLKETPWASFVPSEKAPLEEHSFIIDAKRFVVKHLIKNPLAARVYVRYKYGFFTKIYREWN